ncbi:hypothetical protein W97_00633 [Coniosporium apollinis CBS 100218]|uniref:Uncharacterized protein n=1 Tax=Coniosporium apollinis (strain CBS 100218) TaxID=1168221 RepID=R7YHP9_CONA1|nr:uncharacterized protein W97_00633 [Coniosporium apollinis CBS 100218]EON61418.1 hypothetical protein W97_00633 [Coniosporium apollinis CBS 100218]
MQEYVAYAINYVFGITNRDLSVIAWSQGNLDTQWALKHWPSTCDVVSDFISISADFHGSRFLTAQCSRFPILPCPPSIIQQGYDANFITTLRSDGGDSAYVPTTSIYSAADEFIQPQSGPGASAFINDACGIGATNNELQVICNGRPAGSFVTHEGVLYNPVAFALAVDALINGGPGSTSQIDLTTLCGQVATEGLSLTD